MQNDIQKIIYYRSTLNFHKDKSFDQRLKVTKSIFFKGHLYQNKVKCNLYSPQQFTVSFHSEENKSNFKTSQSAELRPGKKRTNGQYLKSINGEYYAVISKMEIWQCIKEKNNHDKLQFGRPRQIEKNHNIPLLCNRAEIFAFLTKKEAVFGRQRLYEFHVDCPFSTMDALSLQTKTTNKNGHLQANHDSRWLSFKSYSQLSKTIPFKINFVRSLEFPKGFKEMAF